MSHEHCKQYPRPMPSPVMAAIRVRQSRRWVTCGKAYNRHFPRQVLRLAVDNSEDEKSAASFEKIPRVKSPPMEHCSRAKDAHKGYAFDDVRVRARSGLAYEEHFRTRSA